MLFDASALIDYCESDRTVLKLISDEIGQVYVATPVFAEVTQLGPGDCALLGISLVEPETQLFIQAGTKRGALSTNDHLCLLMARRLGWICVSNDGRLRKECEREGVPTLWGLEPLVELVHKGHLPAKEATAIVQMMHEASPHYINENIVALFVERIAHRP